MSWKVDWRRVATGGAVLLLHLLLIFLLLTTTGIVPLQIGNPREIVLTLSPPPTGKHKEPLPVVPNQVPLPSIITRPFVPQAITTPPPSPRRETNPEGDIRGLGRYLFNCSGENFEEMSEEERSHCLANKWDRTKRERAPVLGTAKPTPFDEVIIKRNAPFQAPFQQCDPSSINASLHNVPCTNFQSSHSILEENPGH